MKEALQKYKVIISLLVIVLLTIPLILPYLQNGFFTSHDGEWTVVRLADMFRTIRDGQIPARYSNYLNMQYGYPLFNFAYPLPYYLGLVPVLLKFGFVNSIKLLFILSTLVSGIGMYFLSKTIWKSTISGVVSAILFLYLPYRLVDMFVRGSLGEILAFAIIPYLFLGMYYTITKQSWFYTACTGILLGLLLLSHNIQSLIFAPVLMGFTCLLVYQHRKASYLMAASSFILGIGIASFFVFPALLEKSNILLSVIPIADRSLYFVSLEQLIIPTWGYGIPTDMSHPFSYQLGIAHLGGLILLVITLGMVLLKKNMKHNEDTGLATLILTMIVIAILMLFSFSKPLWELLPLLSEINYPWTLLGPIGFLMTLGLGYVAAQKKYGVLTLVLAGIAIMLTVSYAKPENVVNRGDDYYVTNMATTTSSNEYTPLWVKEMPIQSYDQKVLVGGTATVRDVISDSRSTSFAIDAPTASRFSINTIYYPGWNLFIDTTPTEFRYDNPKGIITGEVSAGTHKVTAVFSETPLRMVSNSITVLSLGISLLLIIVFFKKEFYARH